MGVSKLFRPMSSRLHNQIVFPLVGASLVVGAVATLMGIFLISGVVDSWVGEHATGRLATLESHFERTSDSLALTARFISERPDLVEAIESGSSQSMTGFVVGIRQAVGADSVILVAPDGSAAAVSGSIVIGEEPPFPDDAGRWASLNMAYRTLVEVGGVQTITALRPIEGTAGFRIAVSEVVDSQFLARAGGTSRDVFCFSSPTGMFLASTDRVSGDGQSDTSVWAEIPEVRDAIRSGVPIAAAIEVDDVPYRLQTAPVIIQGDPSEREGHLVAIVDRSAAQETQNATIRLIVIWSVLAIVSLWAIGGFIARRVSTPVTDITASARHVAEGDYSHKVKTKGRDELAQLGSAFNEMTDSLRDRNESLTKKVLELATLYEMSRLLGGTLELEPLLDSVLDSALRIFDVESGYVILRDKETTDLALVVWRGAEEERPDASDLKSSISEWVVREGRPLIFNPTRGEHEPVRVDSVTGSTTALSVPLVSNEGPIGAITVGSKDRTIRFGSDDVRLLSTVANHATIAIGNIELFSSLQEAYLATVRSLAAAVDAKDSYTRGHSDKVAVYAMAIAERMDLSGDQMRTLEMAAYLHDIGKIGVMESILLKPGKLDGEEMGQMKHHPLIGASILKPVVFPWPVAPIIRHHHERWDGQGYPAGLKGEEIPLLARILTVADAYEAMTADRPYRMGRARHDAVEELRHCSGSHFDPAVVNAFTEALEDMVPDVTTERRELREADVQRDEARAVFAAICDGMFSSFRRLGGPRLAANIEGDLNTLFGDMTLPASFSGGRIFFRWDDTRDYESEMDQLRMIVALISDVMEQYAGVTLVDRFYSEALSSLSGRLRMAAASLDLRPKL